MQNSTFKQLFATLNICSIIVRQVPAPAAFLHNSREEFDSTPPSGHNRRRQNQINLSGAGIVISDLFPPRIADFQARLSGHCSIHLHYCQSRVKNSSATPAETNPANAGRQLTESQYTLSAMQIQHFSESGNCTKTGKNRDSA
jgi:hypothetical protein